MLSARGVCALEGLVYNRKHHFIAVVHIKYPMSSLIMLKWEPVTCCGGTSVGVGACSFHNYIILGKDIL